MKMLHEIEEMTPKDFTQATLPPVTDKRLWRIGQMFALCENDQDLFETMMRLDAFEVLSVVAEVMWRRMEDSDLEQLKAQAEASEAAKKGEIH